ncbi:MAG: hypothetical protein WKF57_06310 [Nakamurella sp.]
MLLLLIPLVVVAFILEFRLRDITSYRGVVRRGRLVILWAVAMAFSVLGALDVAGRSGWPTGIAVGLLVLAVMFVVSTRGRRSTRRDRRHADSIREQQLRSQQARPQAAPVQTIESSRSQWVPLPWTRDFEPEQEPLMDQLADPLELDAWEPEPEYSGARGWQGETMYPTLRESERARTGLHRRRRAVLSQLIPVPSGRTGRPRMS